jgi:hypothetical protein
VGGEEQREAPPLRERDDLFGRPFAADHDHRAHVGDLGRVHRLGAGQPGDEQAAVLGIGEHVTHQVGGETQVDFAVQAVLP